MSRSVSNPAAYDDEHERVKQTVQAGKFSVSNANDINSGAFWRLWVQTGGSCDEYIKENIPNYGLIGALLLTISIPTVLSPPDFSSTKDGYSGSWEGFFYLILMNLSTCCSLSLVLFSVVMYTQFTNCINEETRTTFCEKWGSFISVLCYMLIVDGVSLFVALVIAIGVSASGLGTAVSVIELFLALVFIIATSVRIIFWNANDNYGKVVAAATLKSEEDKDVSVQAKLKELKEASAALVKALEDAASKASFA